MNRRDFLSLSAAAAAVAGAGALAGRRIFGRKLDAAAVRPETAASAEKKLAVVAHVREQGAINDRGDVSKNYIGQMLARAVCLATGAETEEQAWRALFDKDDVVGLKVNCLAAPGVAPHPALVYGLAERIARAGVKPGNIVIFDRRESELKAAGFRLNSGSGDFKCIGTDSDGVGYEDEPEMNGEVGSCFSRIVTRKLTALASVAVLKDHDLSGVSLCMKNFYGVIHNPNKYHSNNCDPYIADLIAFPHIRKKLKLAVIDCLRAQYDGGPAFVPRYSVIHGGLILGRDIVAVDAVGASLIEDLRRQNGLPSLAKAERPPKSIATASSRGLGTGELSRIEVLT